MKLTKINLLVIIGLAIVAFFSLKPLFHPGFFPVHDDTQVVRVQQMAEALKDGQFPVRWVKDLGYGYGYPLFNFYAPLAYYSGAFFSFLGFDYLVATKLMFGLGIVLSAVFMYLLAKEFWGRFGGVIAGLFYLFAPYHALDVYVRGAVGEFWAMAFLPLVFLGLYKIYKNDPWGVLWGVTGLAGVILSHNLTALMLLPFLILIYLTMIIFSKNKIRIAYHLSLITIFSLGLSCFYWLPALLEMGFTKVYGQIGGGADFHNHFVFLDQLWASPWGFGGSSAGRLDGMSFMVGKLHIIMVISSLVLAYLFWKKREKNLPVPVIIAVLFFALSVFLTTNYSLFVWEFIKPMAFVQYPWRFIALATLFSSFAAGSIVASVHKKFLPTTVIVIILLFLNLKYFRPQYYIDRSADDYTSEENIKWKTSKISDEYLPKEFIIPQNEDEVALNKIVVLSGEVQIENLRLKSQQQQFSLVVKTPAEILFNTAYFAGWKMWINGEKESFILDEGRIKIALKPGDYSILIRFLNTPLRTVSNMIFMISIVGFGWFVLKSRHGRVRPGGD